MLLIRQFNRGRSNVASAEPLKGLVCARCGAKYAAPARFCSECGGPLRAEAPERWAGGPAAERRHITTMFCDLIGSTSLSMRLDPEEYGQLIQRYRDICSRYVAGGGGVINKFMGDGVLVCFGYPRSHEDDAARACRAGLQIIAAMQDELPTIKVRIAAATGLVISSDIVGNLDVERHAIIGLTPNLVARLQERAPPGGMLIADETRALLGEQFDLEDAGLHDLKGVSRPVRAWRVVGERRVESRFAARAREIEDGLVGRQRERQVLLDRWRSACSGAGQLVVLHGEPGIGKSRLVHELRRILAREPCRTLMFQCSEELTTSTLHPVTAHLAFAARLSGDDSPSEKLAKLRRLFDDHPQAQQSLLPIAAELLALPPPEAHPPVALTPGERKAQVLAAVTNWVTHQARVKPTLLVIEDYHWVDPTTAEWLDLAMHELAALPVLCILTSRSHLSQIASRHANASELSRLSDDGAIELMTRLTAGKALPAEVVESIMARTEGVPLFVEALTKSVLASSLLDERDDGFTLSEPLSTVGIPMTLQDLLSARLDALGPVKAMAQIGSVLGRSFSYEMLAKVSGEPQETLDEALNRLMESDLLMPEPEAHDASYAFKHALIQNAAYESLLLSRRRALHARVADVLATHSREIVEAHPEQLAFHLSRAEMFEAAAQEWHRAGVLSAGRSANREAVLHFESALAMLQKVPVAARNRQLELDALIGLAGAVRATRGYAAPEIGDLSRRALALARELHSDIGELQALSSTYSYHLVAAQYAEAEEVAQELLDAAIRAGRDTYAMIGRRAVGAVAFHRGRLREAEDSLERALSLYNPERHAYLTTIYGSNHAETCACFLSLTKYALGAREEAIALQSWAIDHSRAIGHAHSLSQALAYRSFLFCLAGEPERIEADARAAIALAAKHRFKLMETFAVCTLAVAEAARAPSLERNAAAERAIAGLHALASNALRPFLLTAAAELYRRVGMVEKGVALLDEADATIRETTERWAEAESRRVRGQIGRAHV